MPEVRRATPRDIDDLIELRLLLQPPDPGRRAELAGRLRDYFARAICSGTFVGWVACDDGMCVSTTGLIPVELPPGARTAGRQGHIINVFTREAWRGRGLASSLLEEAIKWSRSEGIERLWLRATDDGRRVYERFGFTLRPRLAYMALDLTGSEGV